MRRSLKKRMAPDPSPEASATLPQPTNLSRARALPNQASSRAHVDESLFFNNLGDAATFATRQLRMRVEENDIKGLISLGIVLNLADESDRDVRVLSTEIENYGALLDWLPDDSVIDDLFAGIDRKRSIPSPAEHLKKGVFVFTIEPDLRLAIPATIFKPYQCQLFLREFRRSTRSSASRPGSSPATIVQVGSTRFQSTSGDLARWAAELWQEIAERADDASDDDRRITLSIYGVKTRLLPFITSVIRSVAKKDAAICDLMSGSGIVTRKIAATHDVFANDANPYGATLAVAATGALCETELSSLFERLRMRMARNVRALEDIFSPYLAMEMELLHSARTAESIERYIKFCAEVPTFFGKFEDHAGESTESDRRLRDLILSRRADPGSFPFILATPYWANVHFGLRQAILLDSLRYAMEAESEPIREVALAA